MQVNDGAAHRSFVRSIQVNFDRQVTVDPGAFELVQNAAGNPTVNVTFNTAVVNDKTVATLTFSGTPVDFTGSLVDGRYNLTVRGDKVHDLFGVAIDGDGNGTPGGDFELNGSAANGLFRMFGDVSGDGAVAANDFIQFRLALGGSNPVFDFDGDGAVAASDFIQFRLRFGGSI